jgi:hypothetical protein
VSLLVDADSGKVHKTLHTKDDLPSERTFPAVALTPVTAAGSAAITSPAIDFRTFLGYWVTLTDNGAKNAKGWIKAPGSGLGVTIFSARNGSTQNFTSVDGGFNTSSPSYKVFLQNHD